jgi:tetratricopeptide (TPR) repeat protein
MPVTLLIFLSATIILSLLRINQTTSSKECLYLGLLLGLASLGDGKFLIFNLLVAFFLINQFKRQYQKVLLPLFLGILTILCLSGLRNYVVNHSWVWISPQSGLSFYTGNNPTAKGYYEHPDFMRPTHQGQDEDQTLLAEQTLGKKLNAMEVSQFWKEKGVNFIKAHPQEYFQLLTRKFQLFFTDVEDAYDIDLIFQRGYKKRWDMNTLSSIFALAFIGMIVSCRRNPQSIILIILIASQLIFTLIFFLTDRHRATILPFLIIFECSALYWFQEFILQKKYMLLTLAVTLITTYVFLFPPQWIAPKESAFLEYSKKGFIYQDQKDYIQAKAMLINALTIHPSDQTSLYNLANNYYAESNLSFAQKLYEQILTLNPAHIDAIFNLAFLYKEKGLNDDAIVLFNKVIQLKENSPDAHLQLGEIYLSQKQCALAQKHFNRVLELKPQFQNEIIRLLSECLN